MSEKLESVEPPKEKDYWLLKKKKDGRPEEREEEALRKRMYDAERELSSNPRSKPAWLSRLSAAEQVLSEEETAGLWQHALKEASLRRHYTEYLCRSFSNFSVDILEKEVGLAIEEIFAEIASDSTPESLREIESEYVDLLYFLSIELRRAGHAERAMAVLQATLELAANNSITDSKTWRDALRSFWESERPRIGDIPNSGMSLVDDDCSLSEAASVKFYRYREPKSGVETEKEELEADAKEESPPPPQLEETTIIEEEDQGSLLEKFEDVRSFKDDGTVYSLKHGYRIGLRRPSSSSYDRALKTTTESSSSSSHRAIDQALARALSDWVKSEDAMDEAHWAPAYSKALDGREVRNDPERIVSFSSIENFVFPVWSIEAKRNLVKHVLEFLGLFVEDAELSSSLAKSSSSQAFVRNILSYAVKNPTLGSVYDSKNDDGWLVELKATRLRFEAKLGNDVLHTLRDSHRSPEMWCAYIESTPDRDEAIRVCHATLVSAPSPQLYLTCVRLHADRNLDRALHVLACFADGHPEEIPKNVSPIDSNRIEKLRNKFETNFVLTGDTMKCFAWFQCITSGLAAGLKVMDDYGRGASHESFRREMVATSSHSKWFRENVLRSLHSCRGRTLSEPIETREAFSRMVHKHPGSKQDWLAAFRNSKLLLSFPPSELADILNQLLDRGIRIRNPEIVAHLE